MKRSATNSRCSTKGDDILLTMIQQSGDVERVSSRKMRLLRRKFVPEAKRVPPIWTAADLGTAVPARSTTSGKSRRYLSGTPSKSPSFVEHASNAPENDQLDHHERFGGRSEIEERSFDFVTCRAGTARRENARNSAQDDDRAAPYQSRCETVSACHTPAYWWSSCRWHRSWSS